MRHTNASLLLASGVQPHVVAQRLGHGIDMLMKTYAHVLPAGESHAAEVAGAFGRSDAARIDALTTFLLLDSVTFLAGVVQW